MVKVVGIEMVDYTSNKTGNKVEGARIHCLTDGRASVVGHAVESFFISRKNVLYERIGVEIKVGGTYDLFYNRYGNVEDIRAASAPAGKKEG